MNSTTNQSTLHKGYLKENVNKHNILICAINYILSIYNAASFSSWSPHKLLPPSDFFSALTREFMLNWGLFCNKQDK